MISPSNYINNYNSDTNKHKGYIHIVTITPKGKLKTIRAYDLQEYQQIKISGNKLISPNYNDLEFNKELNYYYTRAPYKTPTSRLNSDLRGISSIVLDIDYRGNRGLYLHDKEVFKKRIDRNLIAKGLLPNYTTFVFSGTGVQLVYEFEQVSPKAEILIRLMIKVLNDTIARYLRSDNKLSMYQIDNVASNNVGGLARLGGYNTKSGLQVTREHTGTKYTLTTLLERLGVTKDKEVKQSKASTKGLVEVTAKLPRGLIFSLKNRLRKLDIYKELQEAQGLAIGYRNTVLFLYANTVKPLNYEKAQELIYEYNNTFIKPLPKREVDKIIKQLDSGVYKFNNETFDIWLEIDDHNKHLFRTGQYKRKPETIAKAKAQEQERIELLNNPNLNNKHIADKLNVSDRTVRRWRKEYNLPSKYKREY